MVYETVLFRALRSDLRSWDVRVVRYVFAVLLTLLVLATTCWGDAAAWAGGLVAVAALAAACALAAPLGRSSAPADEPAMVSWLGFSMFMDCVFYFVGPARFRDALRGAGSTMDYSALPKDDEERAWLDFCADTGDGFNPCFAVAASMSRRELQVEEVDEGGRRRVVALPRPQLAVHGGDVCYPFPTRDNFERRHILPYSLAWPARDGLPCSRSDLAEDAAEQGAPSMLFVVGNHEGMDGFRGFEDVMMPLKRIGAWRTPQTSTYFTVRLPFQTFLWGIDLGPAPEDINSEQEAFFNSARDALGPGDKVIMVYHVPDWIKTGRMESKDYVRLGKLRASLGARLKLVLTGDLHYYRRMESHPVVPTEPGSGDKAAEAEERPADVADADDEPARARSCEPGKAPSSPTCTSLSSTSTSTSSAESTSSSSSASRPPATNVFESCAQQLLVAGHGGAFSHGTHYPVIPWLTDPATGSRVVNKTCYPCERDSRAMFERRWSTMLFTTRTGEYLRVLGAVYAVMFAGRRGPPTAQEWAAAGPAYLAGACLSGAFFLCIVWMLVTHHILVTASHEQHSLWQQFKIKSLVVVHTSLHVTTAAACRVFFDSMVWPVLAHAVPSLQPFYTGLAVWFMFLAGVLPGGLVMSGYLYVSVTFLDYHWNEAISSMVSQDHKGFVRLALSPDGAIDVYAIGIDEVPKKWARREPTEGDPALKGPADDDLRPRLIERIKIRGAPLAAALEKK
jgi:hypothetical protein